MAKATDPNLSQIGQTGPSGQTDTRTRAQRLETEGAVLVAAKTIGTLATYSMRMANVSRTGVLLSALNTQRPPYHVGTLLELSVDPRGERLAGPVACLGRVVRAGVNASGKAEYGVHLIMLEARDEANWGRAFGELSADGADPRLLVAA